MKTGQGNGQNMSEYGMMDFFYQRFLNAKTHSYHRKFWLQRKVELKKKSVLSQLKQSGVQPSLTPLIFKVIHTIKLTIHIRILKIF